MKDPIWEFVYSYKTVLLFKYNILQLLSINCYPNKCAFYSEYFS